MRYNKIFLINPYIPGSYMGPVRPPASLGYIAEYIVSGGLRCEAMDMGLGYGFRHLRGRIELFRPDIIGVTAWTYRYKNTYALIEKIKKKYPDIPIAAGGPHISTLRKKALEECASIDYGVVLEGEQTMLELCAGKAQDEIKGLIYRRNGRVHYGEDRDFIVDIDSLPFPRYERFELNKYFLKEILIISSRGCPHECIYCPCRLAIGKRLRMRSAKSVVDEMAYWYNRGYRRFNFGDDNFTFFKGRVYEICDEINKRNLKDLDLRCGNGIRADKVDRQLLKRMREAGFSYIGLGVEAGNDRVLKRIKKGETINQIEGAIRDACDLGFDVTLFFLAGSPTETWSDIMDSVRLAEKYPVMDARFYNIIPYPSTELFDWVRDNKLFVLDPEDYLNDASAFANRPIFQTPELSVAERKRALAFLKKVEKRILRNTFRRKFAKFGLMGDLTAFFASGALFRYLIRHNRFLRGLGERIRYDLRRERKKA